MYKVVWCCYWVLASLPVQAWCSNAFSFLGEAYDPVSNQLLYSELHNVQLDKHGNYLSATVDYVSPDGEKMASKQVDYSVSALVPNVVYEDFRVRLSYSVSWREPELTIRYAESISRQAKRLQTNPEEKHTVVDAGFDRLVANEWDRLEEGKVIPFAFVSASRAELFAFQLRLDSQDQFVSRFVIEPRFFLLRVLVDPIYVSYNKATKQLVRYEGITNIPIVTSSGERATNYIARIDYKY